ncbi:DNA sulfur modification protein DndD [Myxococcota bacterium]|nr:DNA sulfur modification protein DndD [Myxococcota bacterium]
MIFRSLVFQNYGPFRGVHIIEVAPTRDVQSATVCLVGALNGSGKTSFLEGVLLALYGPRARLSQRGALAWPEFLRAARNRDASVAEPTEVTLRFDHTDANGTRSIRVTRRWHLTPGDVADGMSVEVFHDPSGRWAFDAELTETWAERVEELVPLGISGLFFFDGEQVRSLAVHDTPPEEVREAVRSLLGLDLPHRLAQDLSVITARRLRDNATPTDQQKALELEGRIKVHHAEEAASLTALEALRARLGEAQAALKRAREGFTVSGADITLKRGEVEDTLREAREAAAEVRAEMVDLAAGPLPLRLVDQLLKRALQAASEEVTATERALLADHIKERDEKVVQILADLRAGPELIKRLKEKLYNDRLTVERQPKRLGVTRAELHVVEAVAGAGLRGATIAARSANERLAKAEVTVDTQAAKLGAAAPAEQASLLVSELETRAQAVGVLEEAIRVAEERHQTIVIEGKRLDDQLNKQLVHLKAAHEVADATQRIVGAAGRVTDLLSRYAERLKEKKLARVEELITERLQRLARKGDWIHRVTLDPETFALTLHDAEGRSVDKARLSAGEQQLLAVAYLWALSLASGRNLPVVIDTPLSRMDSEHRAALVERYFPHASHQVILLSTDTEIDEAHYAQLKALDVLDRVIRIQHDPEMRSSKILPGYFWS